MVSGYGFNWSNGQTSSTATGLSNGTYVVTVSDANNCQATASVTISQPSTAHSLTAAITSDYNGSDISCHGLSDGEATAYPTGGVGPYSFLWSNGQNDSIAINLAAGSYQVTSTDANGCTATASVTLTDPRSVTATIN